MANSRPTNGTPTSSPETNGSSHSSARRAAGSPESPIVQGLDTLYDKLSSASLSLKSLSPMLPSEGSPQPAPEAASATRAEDPRNDASRSALAIDSGASSPKDASGGSGAANQKPEARSPNECDPGCVCRQVLLAASPGACGICGGRPGTLAKLNDDRSRALEDLDIATQRINELAHEKARHVDYIADLEMRVAEQAKKIDQQRDVIAGLKNDLSAMNDKFVDQVNMTAEIAHSRELVEAELEDLTQKLFTEANTMVAAEKKARVDAEKTSGHLRNVIADLETRLSSETMQSHELKERIEKMSAEYDDLLLKSTMVSSRRGSIGSHLSDMAGGDNASLRREGSMVSGSASGAHGDGFRLAPHAAALMIGTKAYPSSPGASTPIRLDEQLLAEFKDFAIQTQSQRQTGYMSMSYMKSVVSADVEPCLRFGPHPRISSRNVLDAIASNRIQIEEMTPQIAAEMRRAQQASERPNANRHAMIWERLSGSVAFNPHGCQACGRECQQCTYRFRMGFKPDSEWIQVDTMCRDRLVAVCEFYGFVRYLHQGIFASRSIMELYMETIRLRLSMFYSRIGAYGYAIDVDPSLAEAPPFLRNPGSIHQQPDSPTSFSHALPNVHASPMPAPYISSSRAASAANVAIWQDTARTSSSLAIDASDAVNRLRSRSQETSALPSSASAIAIPAPVALSPSGTSKDGLSAHQDSAAEEPDAPLPINAGVGHTQSAPLEPGQEPAASSRPASPAA
ncbi:hypothetical protein LPJ63_004555 [Coemansia sp. RSA 2711]|nr:hypothetical protein LPJ63_004555 [Coemansia sp. RSA 2711]KAJ2316729.1 hypothetical protein IWW52_003494 [Coemansia sp. RSA 2704]